ncbi:MAG: DUF3368 domain-containing protein [Thermodesulfovibrionales bacterium]|nr:DUF3368 domain-containing protein [Thermodesulfovibrionales bacterium]
MPVVSDADVIIHLSRLKKLSLLKQLYSEVFIPEYVKNELSYKKDLEIQEALSSFIKPQTVPVSEAEAIARKHGIHMGEAHVKALGEKLRAELFLSNERKVRSAAKEEGFKITGTIGIILKAAVKGMVTKEDAELLLENMKDEDFRIHPELIQQAIDFLMAK